MATVAKDTTPLPSMPEPPAEVVQAPQRALPTVPKTAPVPPKAPIAKVDLPSIPEDVIEEEDPAVLKSQMKAMENEILNLRMEKTILEGDKEELGDAIQRLKNGVRNSEETTDTFKTENQTLKCEIKKHMENKISMQKEINQLLQECTSLKERLKNSEEDRDNAEDALTKFQHQQERLMEESRTNIKCLRDSNAQEIGKLKRVHEEEVQSILQNKSKQIHELETQWRNNKTTLQDTVTELKDTISNMAIRITSYEKRIDMLDTENHRLRVSTQITQRNKLSVTQQNEIEALKNKSISQQEDIERLQSALALFHINSHHDFRNIS